MSRFELSGITDKQRGMKILFFPIPIFVVLLVAIYRYDREFEALSEGWCWTLVGILVVAFLVCSFVLYLKYIRNAKLLRQLELKDGVLRIGYRQGNRGELWTDIPVKDFEYDQNDEERVIIKSAKGEFRFMPMDFASVEEYERFRMELTCEHFKEE